MFIRILALCTIALLVQACGGGGGSADNKPPPPPPLPAGTVALSNSTFAVTQNTGLLTVEVSRANGSRDGTVSYATADGTAVAGTDYTARTGTLAWSSGDASAKTISLPISTTAASAGGKTFSLALSSPTNGIELGATTAATVTIVAPPTTPAARSVSVRGNRLIDASGNLLQLRGVSFSGFEYVAIYGFNPGDPSGAQAGQPNGPRWTAVKNWHANTVRFTLNEASWLGYTCVDTDGVTRNPDPGGNYRSHIQQQVKEANDAELYVILELQWAAPGTTCPMYQTQMADADHSIAFWTSVATLFKDNPTVIFALYNEPFFYGLSSETEQWRMMMTGGTLPYYPASSATSNYQEIKTTWSVASMQAMIDAIRATSATNVILVGGTEFANNLSGWLANRPRDALNQIAAAWHPYPPQQAAATAAVSAGGTGYALNDTITLANPNTVYTPAVLKVTGVGAGGAVSSASVVTGGTYLQIALPTAAVAQGSTSGSGAGATFTLGGWRNISSTWSMPTNWATVQAVTAQVPLVVSETGEHNSPGTSGAPFLQQLLPFAGASNWSVIGCCWDVFNHADNVLIKDVDGTPTDGYGKVFYDWMTGAAWQ